MERLVNECTKKGALKEIQWLYASKRCTFTANTCFTAALCGHLDVLVWLREVGTPWNRSVYSAAVVGKHKHILEHMQHYGFEPDNTPAGSIPCAEFLGTPCVGITGTVHPDTPPATLAIVCIAIGDLDLLKMVVVEGCEVNAVSCAFAAKRGHLKILKWLKEDAACDWDSRTFESAVRSGQGHIIDYLLETRCPHYKTIPQDDTGCTLL